MDLKLGLWIPGTALSDRVLALQKLWRWRVANYGLVLLAQPGSTNSFQLFTHIQRQGLAQLIYPEPCAR